MSTFVLNDENITNSYGFRVLNKGIDLKRFKANPIMLDSHWNSNSSVIGRWVNIRTEDGRLMADAEFDTEDADANKLAGKVERGYIKSCSMGIRYDRDHMKANPDGTYTLTKSELMEASIVAVPANANALRLYAATGELLNDSEIKLSIQNLKLENKPSQMENNKFTLSAQALTALGLANADDANAVSTAIVEMQSKYEKTKQLLSAMQDKAAKELEARANALVNNAVKDGKLSADVKDSFLTMAKDNYELAAKVIDSMPGKQSLAGKVGNPDTGEIKTVDDFVKLPLEKQLQFKKEQPEAYQKLFV